MPNITNTEAIHAWSTFPAELIEQIGDEGDFARQHLLNPVLFALLGDVKDKAILDAGCGQGYLARLLARKGAFVTGVEPADSLYAYAFQKEQTEKLGITYIQADLSSLDTFHGIFDYVIANMVLMDIPDYQAAIHNCIASLNNNGIFIFSILHPCFEETGSEWTKKRYVEVSEYFQERAIKQNIGYMFHRPLSAYMNFVIQQGCNIRSIIEPQLDTEVADRYGNDRDLHVPSFLVIEAVRYT
jgi:2-polyprenyl-3-methyl-5-hydroxy-6-metoxy-1,4-benzoquinol methylase